MIKTKPRLRYASVSSAISQAAEVCILDHVRHRGRNKRRPVLTEECEGARLIVEPAINSDPRQADRRLAGTNRRDVAIVHAGKVTFEVEFDLARERDLGRRVKPFEVRT